MLAAAMMDYPVAVRAKQVRSDSFVFWSGSILEIRSRVPSSAKLS
jgi:hypothetical protein